MEKVCSEVTVLVVTWQVLLLWNVSLCILLIGLWHYRPSESLPSLVLAGSSNFGKQASSQ